MDAKGKAILAHITIIGWIIALFSIKTTTEKSLPRFI